jgi:multiple sugar transport system permease protein
VLALVVVSVFPIAFTLFLGVRAVPNGFAALYADPSFWAAAGHTLKLAAIALPTELLLGLALAGIFLGPMPGKAVFVHLIALPALVAPVIGGATWRMLLDNDYGPINYLLGAILPGAVVVSWTEDARFAYPAILVADIWQWTPLMFVLLLAGLKNIDSRLLLLAQFSDAGPWRTLFRIVLPAILPAIGIAILIRALDLLRLFDVVWLLTPREGQGGTETISVFAFENIRQASDPGSTAALAFITTLGVSLAVMLLLGFPGRTRRS